MKDISIQTMSDLLLDFFGEETRAISKQCGFTQRESKLTGQKFASSLVLGFLNNPNSSLEDICQLLKKGGVQITKQGLQERMNEKGVNLMNGLFEESIKRFKNKTGGLIDILKPFSSVHILDRSGFSLPPKLKDDFRGNGGSASEAGLRMQVLWDYFHGIDGLWITDSRSNDQGFKSHLSCLKENGLYLQDLGYFVIDNFKHIQSQGAYFISRFLKKTLVYTPEGEEIDLLAELKKAGTRFEREVCIGKTNRFLVRMVAERVPKEVAEKRTREEIAYGKRKKYIPCQRSIELMNWSIYITNVPAALLTLDQILVVYKLRWQIEIFLNFVRAILKFIVCQGKNERGYYVNSLLN